MQSKSLIRKTLRAIGYFALVPVMFVALSVILPWCFVSDYLQLRSLAKRACEACGAPLGRAEIDRARAEYRERTQQTVKDSFAQGLRSRIATIWHIRCPQCNTEHRYTPAKNQFARAIDG